jgi:hypothetical protein
LYTILLSAAAQGSHLSGPTEYICYFISPVSITEMWCWRRMEKISWTDHVRKEEVLLRVNEKRNILHEIRKREG